MGYNRPLTSSLQSRGFDRNIAPVPLPSFGRIKNLDHFGKVCGGNSRPQDSGISRVTTTIAVGCMVESCRPSTRNSEFLVRGRRPSSRLTEFLPRGQRPRTRLTDFLVEGRRPRTRLTEFLVEGRRPRTRLTEFLVEGRRPRTRLTEFLVEGRRPSTRKTGASTPRPGNWSRSSGPSVTREAGAKRRQPKPTTSSPSTGSRPFQNCAFRPTSRVNANGSSDFPALSPPKPAQGPQRGWEAKAPSRFVRVGSSPGDPRRESSGSPAQFG